MFPGLALEVRHRKNEISYGKSLLGRPKRDGTMIKKITSYQADLIEALKDPRDAAAYFNAAIEGGDKEVILLAIQNMTQAYGEMPTRSRRIPIAFT